MTMGLSQMSSTNHHMDGSSNSAHGHGDSVGHESTDFNWTLVLFSLPIGAFILLAFTYTCLFFFRGYKDDELGRAQSKLETTQLNILHASENEALSSYKMIDGSKGQVQIPIAHAMELVVAEHANTQGKDWKPITDIYMEGAAVAKLSTSETDSKMSESGENGNGISIEEAKDTKSTLKTGTGKSESSGKKHK
jgi:hypothetical protein